MARYLLTDTVEQSIVSFIIAGGFPHVAAEASGIPMAVFDDWLARGDQREAPKKYRRFADAIRRATAQARLSAEVEIRKAKPLDWLKSGPGRESRRSNGWTAAVRASPDKESGNALTPEVQKLVASLLEALDSHPDARIAAATALELISSDSASTRARSRSSQA